MRDSTKKQASRLGSLYVRNIIFGVEDSLVSTVGVLSGIAATTGAQTVILVGAIYITVEAFSMAVGSFLSEEFTEEYEARGKVPLTPAMIAGGTMFVASIVAGFIPLLPYLLLGREAALVTSIGVSLLLLFVVGAVSGHASHAGILRDGFRMVLVGGLAIVLGIFIGWYLG